MPRKKSYQWQDGGLSPQGEGLSRSAKKRQSHALQALGEELSRLAPSDWQELPLGPDLLEALTMYARISDHEGRRRQMQYIGRLMREIDAEPLRQALEARKNASAADTARFHQLEQWRERLLSVPQAELETALQQLLQAAARVQEVPRGAEASLQRLAVEARQARAEAAAGHKAAPHASRALFRLIKGLLTPDAAE